jgi:phosphocarrier protein HPr
VVANREGIHARPAAMIATVARKFPVKVEVVHGAMRVEATDVLQLLSLGAAQGERLTLVSAGPNGIQALDALEQLFLKKFDED